MFSFLKLLRVAPPSISYGDGGAHGHERSRAPVGLRLDNGAEAASLRDRRS